MNTTTTTQPAIISAIRVHDYKFELSINIKGKPVARKYKYMTAGKNKDNYRLIEGFYFNDEQRRETWIKEQIARINERRNEENQRKEAKQAIRANMQHGFEVGQVYYTSWGYDQTNVDFYIVLEVKGKRVLVQEIGAKMLNTEGYSSMAAMVVPDQTNKVGEPSWRNIQFYLGSDNTPTYYIKEPRHCNYNMYLYTKSDKGVYCSWYA